MIAGRAREHADLLKALAHPTRLQILDELSTGTKCVTDMEDLLPARQANVSQHMAVLRHAKLVNFVQAGALRCYYLSRPRLVKGVFSLLGRDHPVVEKNKADLKRERARPRKGRESAG
jgi:ArsR family transcriptional regulator